MAAVTVTDGVNAFHASFDAYGVYENARAPSQEEVLRQLRVKVAGQYLARYEKGEPVPEIFTAVLANLAPHDSDTPLLSGQHPVLWAAAARQQELLAKKDEDLEKLERKYKKLADKLEKAQEALSCDRGYLVPGELEDDPQLPLPRLDIFASKLTDRHGCYGAEYHYRLVRRHLLGHIETVGLGHTRSEGNRVRSWPLRCVDGTLEQPYQDSAHMAYDAAHLQLPAFITYEGCAPEPVVFDDACDHKYQYAKGAEARRAAQP